MRWVLREREQGAITKREGPVGWRKGRCRRPAPTPRPVATAPPLAPTRSRIFLAPPRPPLLPAAGYVRHYRVLEKAIRSRFAGAPLTFSSTATPGATGWFEVSVNGSLVFSKKGGQGYWDTPAKQEQVYAAIEAALGPGGQ